MITHVVLHTLIAYSLGHCDNDDNHITIYYRHMVDFTLEWLTLRHGSWNTAADERKAPISIYRFGLLNETILCSLLSSTLQWNKEFSWKRDSLLIAEWTNSTSLTLVHDLVFWLRAAWNSTPPNAQARGVLTIEWIFHFRCLYIHRRSTRPVESVFLKTNRPRSFFWWVWSGHRWPQDALRQGRPRSTVVD